MQTPATRGLALFLSVVCCCLPACRPKALTGHGVAIWGPNSYWFAAKQAGQKPSPGVDQGSIAAGLCFQIPAAMTPAFAVWVGEGGGGSISGRTEVLTQEPLQRVCHYTGTLAGVPIECRTPDGKTGTIKVGSQSFELAQGALFLVSKAGTNVVVKQTQITKLNLRPDGTLPTETLTIEFLRELARTDPELQAFWNPAAVAK